MHTDVCSRFTWLLLLASILSQTSAQSAQESTAFFESKLSSLFNATWDAQVRQLCSAASLQVQKMTNPSGLLACYNVAAIQPSTGLFAGDLRLYTAGQSSLQSGTFISTNLEFGKLAQILNFTESTVANTRQNVKRAPQVTAVNPISTVRPGSTAAVAEPQAGIKAITSSARLGESTVSPAILPGERRLSVQRQAVMLVLPSGIAAQPVDVGSFQTATVVAGAQSTISVQVAGTQVQVIQFLGRINLDRANANSDGSGVLGALLPKIFLVTSGLGAPNGTIDMNPSTRSFLTGVRGKATPVGTFVLPGRILGGADHSVNLIGLYFVGIYLLFFTATMFSGILTRWNMRKEYRKK